MHRLTRPGTHMHACKHAHDTAFPQQQWLRERFSILCCTYIACIVAHVFLCILRAAIYKATFQERVSFCALGNAVLSIRRVYVRCEKRLLTSSCLSVRPSVNVYQRGFHWENFCDTWYSGLLRKSENLQVLGKTGQKYWAVCICTWVRFYCGRLCEIFCSSKIVRRETILAFIWKQWTLLYFW